MPGYPGRPALATVRSWIGVPQSELDDGQLQGILDAEITLQAGACPAARDPDAEFPPPLAQGLLRRCARAAAARGIPLGTLPIQSSGYGDGMGYGALLIPRIDAEIERYEGDYRTIAFA